VFFRIRNRRSRDTRGQALVEFALVLPLLVLILMGVMQFGLLFWTQITLTQIARDTGRWVASQESCVPATVNVGGQANAIAARSSLFGWGAGNPITLSSGPTYTNLTPPPHTSAGCPPQDNREVWNVTFELSHTVPTFMPLLGPTWTLRSEVQFRMEPAPK
jgi:Flp pilus assembly protein TadG